MKKDNVQSVLCVENFYVESYLKKGKRYEVADYRKADDSFAVVDLSGGVTYYEAFRFRFDD